MIATMSAQNANNPAYVTIEPPPLQGRYPSAVVVPLPGTMAKGIVAQFDRLCKIQLKLQFAVLLAARQSGFEFSHLTAQLAVFNTQFHDANLRLLVL